MKYTAGRSGSVPTWAYDSLGRVTSVTYQDGTAIGWEYDAAGNPVEWTDPLGTVVEQTFDPMGRLAARQITPAAGVEGATAESYDYDGLGRPVRAESGGVVTERVYDSLSRQVSETTAGRTVASAYDDASGQVALEYPSGRVVGRQLDVLGRPVGIGPATGLPTGGQPAPGLDAVATFGYRGPDLVATRTLGGGPTPVLTAAMDYDPARRLLGAVYRDPTTREVLAESLGWSERSLLATQTRGDLDGRVRSFGYDGAGRLTGVERTGGGFPGLPEIWGFGYDTADNLLTRTEQSDAGTRVVDLPLDGSGRNRPGSAEGTSLAWNAAGNLVQKGSTSYHYDFRNRLVRVSDPGGTLATYDYDALNRRVRRTAGGVVTETAWSGWQPVEEFAGGVLAERRTYGGRGSGSLSRLSHSTSTSSRRSSGGSSRAVRWMSSRVIASV